MKEESKTKLLNVIRWLLFLPASVLGAWLAYIIFSWMNHTIPVFNADNLWNKIIDLVAQFIMGAAFVGIGTSIVPKGNKIVAIILCSIMCLICGVAFAGNILGNFSWMHLLGELCTIAGAVCVLCYFVKEEK